MAGKSTDSSSCKCCFCNLLIDSSFSDPCEIDILINMDKPKNQQYSQVFYCHMICLKKQFHAEIQQNYFYLESLVKSKNSPD